MATAAFTSISRSVFAAIATSISGVLRHALPPFVSYEHLTSCRAAASSASSFGGSAPW
jgi:hypothetical protein